MPKSRLRTAAISCLVIWAVLWSVFLLIRFSSLDIRVIPGIGPIMLAALAFVLLAPIAASMLAGAALLRQPRWPSNWLTLGCAIAVFLGQGVLFLSSRWL